jgi:hypothetical protein
VLRVTDLSTFLGAPATDAMIRPGFNFTVEEWDAKR